MKICETLLALGEVSVENETYEQAVTDITECLNKRKVGRHRPRVPGTSGRWKTIFSRNFIPPK